MIAQRNRFHGHGSLRFVYQHGKNTRGQFFAIKFIENKKRDTYRLAVVVSKKVSKSAVVRNRIRRRIYEVFRSLQMRTDLAHDIVITVYSEQIASMEHKELRQQIIDQLKQADVIS